MYRGGQNEFNWRPRFKQRGLFSDRDPSLEIELENRLIESVQDIAQHVPEHHVNKRRCASDCAELRRGCLTYMMQPVCENTDRPSRLGLVCLQKSFRSVMFGSMEGRCFCALFASFFIRLSQQDQVAACAQANQAL